MTFNLFYGITLKKKFSNTRVTGKIYATSVQVMTDLLYDHTLKIYFPFFESRKGMRVFQLLYGASRFKHVGHYEGDLSVTYRWETAKINSEGAGERERKRDIKKRESVSESSTLDSSHRSSSSTHHHNFHRLLLRSDL